MISIDQLLQSLFQDVAKSGSGTTPGDMVQQSLGGQPPQDAPMSLPMSLGGPRSGMRVPGPQAVPGPRMPSAAPAPVKTADAGPYIPGNALTDFSQGYSSGGLVGAIGNLMQGPETRAALAQQYQKQQAEAQAQQNMTMNALRARDPSMGADLAATIARNPKLLQEYLAPVGSGGTKYGKTGAIFQGPDGGFYSIQFAEDGTKKIEPVAIDGKGLSPARGVHQVGDELIDKATGQPVRNIGQNLTREKIAEGAGTDIAKTRAELPEAKQRLGLVTDGLDRLERTAKALETNPGLSRVAGGLYEAYAPNISETARNAATELENLKIKISGVVLQNMRDMSKTGGAVGQVTEREWPRLENMISNLDPRQGSEQFMRNLREIVDYAQSVKSRLRQAYEADLRKAGVQEDVAAQPDRQQAMPDPLGIRGR